MVRRHEKQHASQQQTQVGRLVALSSAQLHLSRSEWRVGSKREVQGEGPQQRGGMEREVCVSKADDVTHAQSWLKNHTNQLGSHINKPLTER